MKLNIEKIKSELDRIGENEIWLANQMKRSKQQINYLLSGKKTSGETLKTIARIGEALGVDPKFLII